ncbi:hypothetical protein [Streptomyces chromofuscus]|nr:hypothetical protein [Streptomyces chromofuscus]
MDLDSIATLVGAVGGLLAGIAAVIAVWPRRKNRPSDQPPPPPQS